MPGLTLTGFETLTLGDLRELLNAAWRKAFGDSMDVSDRSPDGQLIGIAVEAPALLWELGEAISSSQDPTKATGAALRAICLLTGTVPSPATFSAVTLTLTGTPTTPVTAGQLVATLSTGRQFITLNDVTIAAATAWAGTTTYTLGDRRTNVSRVYLCITGGTSAGSGGPTTIAADITDGTVHWRYLGEGAGNVDVAARATEVGPIVAVSGDLTAPATFVGGWSSAINILDAALGRDEMTDAALRALRELEIARPGTSPKDAVRAALFDLDDVEAVTVFQNVSDVTDGDGLPPHSLEALVQGGEDQGIWDTLFANVAGGIRTYGTEVGSAVDSSGVSQAQAFSRSVDVLVYVAVTLVKDPVAYPADGDEQVKLAIATWGNEQTNGRNVVSSAIGARAFGVTGVLEVSAPLISVAPTTTPVASTTIQISLRQRAVYDTSRITVTSSDGTP